jgi:hypothetical protein
MFEKNDAGGLSHSFSLDEHLMWSVERRQRFNAGERIDRTWSPANRASAEASEGEAGDGAVVVSSSFGRLAARLPVDRQAKHKTRNASLAAAFCDGCERWA